MVTAIDDKTPQVLMEYIRWMLVFREIEIYEIYIRLSSWMGLILMF